MKPTPARIKFGERIRELRGITGYSQEELGFQAGLTEHALVRLKEGNKTFPSITYIS
jgi:transcriptional regulator with XRE-family HTH domain